MPEVAARNDPYVSARFFVQIDGIEHAGFTECAGLQAETEVMEYAEGGNNGFVHKLAGRTKFSNVTLKWGSTDSHALWAWYHDVTRGTVERKDVSVVLYTSLREEVRRWNLREAYPVKWIGAPFNGATAQVGIESIELAHHGFEVE